MGKSHSKPSNEILHSLQESTYFDRKEIIQYYDGFLKQAPSGAISQSHFTNLYTKFFPFGDPIPFAKLVFRSFDKNESGAIEFDEYLRILSITSRGRLEEKIKWAFEFYDLDGDTKISEAELLLVISAIYRMTHGSVRRDPTDTPNERTALILTKLDTDKDGKISIEEFKDGIQSDENVLQGLLLYDGLI